MAQIRHQATLLTRHLDISQDSQTRHLATLTRHQATHLSRHLHTRHLAMMVQCTPLTRHPSTLTRHLTTPRTTPPLPRPQCTLPTPPPSTRQRRRPPPSPQLLLSKTSLTSG